MIEYITWPIIIIGLIIGSYTDIKTREVPDWVNYALIFIGLGIHLLFSIIYWDLKYILAGAAGFILFMGIAYGMFYTGQWGGGDSKMLMAVGALIGLPIMLSFKGTIALWQMKIPLLCVFFILALFAGAVYGLIWAVTIAIIKRKKFVKELKKNLFSKKTKKLKLFLLITAVIIVILAFLVNDLLIRLMLFIMAVIMIILFYMIITVRSIEKACMERFVNPKQLTEGDWIVKEIKVKGKLIVGPKDLGISKKQIQLLKKLKIKKVLIKEGIPFVPSFLIAFVLAIIIRIMVS